MNNTEIKSLNSKEEIDEFQKEMKQKGWVLIDKWDVPKNPNYGFNDTTLRFYGSPGQSGRKLDFSGVRVVYAPEHEGFWGGR